MKFGQIIDALNEGLMAARSGWNGKGMFIYKTVGNVVEESFIPNFKSLPANVKTFLQAKGGPVTFHPSITMYTAQGDMQPGWLCSQTDMMADDWCTLNEKGEVVEPQSGGN